MSSLTDRDNIPHISAPAVRVPSPSSYPQLDEENRHISGAACVHASNCRFCPSNTLAGIAEYSVLMPKTRLASNCGIQLEMSDTSVRAHSPCLNRGAAP